GVCGARGACWVRQSARSTGEKKKNDRYESETLLHGQRNERSECKPDRAQPPSNERSECKPDAQRKRDSAQPQDRAQPPSNKTVTWSMIHGPCQNVFAQCAATFSMDHRTWLLLDFHLCGE